MALPANVNTGLVTGRFLVGVIDGPDPDDEPDGISAQGTITFTASVPYLPNPTAAPAAVTILKAPIIGVLDADGYLCVRRPDGTAGARGVRLVATDDPDLSVQGWTWTVTYAFEQVNGVRPQIASHSMALPSDSTVDLTSVVRVPSSTGIGIEQAEALVAAAQAAAETASQAAQATDAGVATLLTTGAQTAPLLAAKVDRGALYVEASDYGAVGDGVTDDTAALQAWLDAPGPVRRLHDGIYRITAPLTSTEDGRTITTDGAKIVADAPEATALTVTGDDCRVSVHIDGSNTAASGLLVTGARAIIEDSTFENFRSVTWSANGVRVETLGGVTIRNNTFRDIVAVGNEITGDGVGASRAIVITQTGGSATAANIIDGNTIERIAGEEGDAIQVMLLDGGRDARARITDNTIRDVTRRAIKIQASGCHVEGNIYENPGPAPTNPSALIDVQYVNDVDVVGNTLDATHFMGVQVTGRADGPCEGITVTGNTINDYGTSVYGVTALFVRDVLIAGNYVRGFAGPIRIGGAEGAVIEGNAIRGGRGSEGYSAAIRVQSDCGNVIVRGNIGFDGPRTTLVENDSPAAIIESNHARFTTTATAIRGMGNAAGSVYRANTSNAPGPAASGAFTDQTVTQTRALAPDGSAGVGADISWGTENPSTATPNRRASRGDVVFNQAPSPGGFVGWICVTAGTPGVWKTFAVVAS